VLFIAAVPTAMLHAGCSNRWPRCRHSSVTTWLALSDTGSADESWLAWKMAELTEARTAGRRDTAGAGHRPAAAPNSPVPTSSRAVGSDAGSAVGSCATPRGVPLAHVMKRLSYRGTGAPFAPGQAESYCARTGALPAVCLESFARRTDRVMKGNRRVQMCAPSTVVAESIHGPAVLTAGWRP
jgi:hypothetical protein